MPYKVLGQAKPAAATDTTLYTVPGASSAIVSTLTICNQSAAVIAAVRVAVRPAGAALDAVHYILWEQGVTELETLFITIGITLAATDVVTVRSSIADVSFSLFGQEP